MDTTPMIAVRMFPGRLVRFDAPLNCANYLHLPVDEANEIREGR
jgi:hypothetical protein